MKSLGDLSDLDATHLAKLSKHLIRVIVFIEDLEEQHNKVFVSLDKKMKEKEMKEKLSPEVIEFYTVFHDLVDEATNRRTLTDQWACSR